MSNPGSFGSPNRDENHIQIDEPTRASNNRDLVDTFELFKTYFDNKIGDRKSELVQEQDFISRKLKEEVSIKFKHEGNKIQHKFNEEVVAELQKLY